MLSVIAMWAVLRIPTIFADRVLATKGYGPSDVSVVCFIGVGHAYEIRRVWKWLGACMDALWLVAGMVKAYHLWLQLLLIVVLQSLSEVMVFMAR